MTQAAAAFGFFKDIVDQRFVFFVLFSPIQGLADLLVADEFFSAEGFRIVHNT